METFLLLHFMFLWAQHEFFFYVVAIPTSSTKSPLYIKDGESLNLTCEEVQDAGTVFWYRNNVSVLTIIDTINCNSIKADSLDTSNYSVTCNRQKKFSVLKYGVNRSDDNTNWNCQMLALDYTTNLGTSSGVQVYIYKFPNNFSMVGNDSGILSDGDYVHLSVSTGCINPSDPAYYNVTWKYVEATKTAENNFDEKIMQYVNSSGGCTNAYERNLTFNVIVTNAMNTGNTSLNISQVKITLTMAGIDFFATKNVLYTLNPKVTTTTTTTPTSTTGNNLLGLLALSIVPIAAGGGYAIYRSKKSKNTKTAVDAKGSTKGNPADRGSKNTKGDKKTKDQQSKTTDNGQEKHENTHPLVKANRIGRQDGDKHESVSFKPFDKNERRPLPLDPASNDQNKRGISANYDEEHSLAHDTPGAPKLAPIDPKLLSTIQGEDNSEKPRKKEKKRKNKKTDEIKSTDDLGE